MRARVAARFAGVAPRAVPARRETRRPVAQRRTRTRDGAASPRAHSSSPPTKRCVSSFLFSTPLPAPDAVPTAVHDSVLRQKSAAAALSRAGGARSGVLFFTACHRGILYSGLQVPRSTTEEGRVIIRLKLNRVTVGVLGPRTRRVYSESEGSAHGRLRPGIARGLRYEPPRALESLEAGRSLLSSRKSDAKSGGLDRTSRAALRVLEPISVQRRAANTA